MFWERFHHLEGCLRSLKRHQKTRNQALKSPQGDCKRVLKISGKLTSIIVFVMNISASNHSNFLSSHNSSHSLDILYYIWANEAKTNFFIAHSAHSCSLAVSMQRDVSYFIFIFPFIRWKSTDIVFICVLCRNLIPASFQLPHHLSLSFLPINIKV